MKRRSLSGARRWTLRGVRQRIFPSARGSRGGQAGTRKCVCVSACAQVRNTVCKIKAVSVGDAVSSSSF